jgi:aminopeptidase-like protein
VDSGEDLHAFAARLQPLPRSLTGDGVRATLRAIDGALGGGLEIHEVPSGTAAFDWTVPEEWTLRRAWIRGPHGETIADTDKNLLHVVGYSAPIRARLPLSDLKRHLHSLPERPDAIPYRTAYYDARWGFCLPHRILETLPDGDYDVEVDATLAAGHLTYGEIYRAGSAPELGDLLVTTHVCHPVLANDNLSGLAVATALARSLGPLRHGLRVLFLPGTIGSLVWLARNEGGAARRVRHGLVLSNLGDPGPFHYKRSRRGGAVIDRAAAVALRDSGHPHAIEDFEPYGYDERQFNSPGFDLPVGALSRTPWGRYPEYHTSDDDLSFIRPAALGESLAAVRAIVEAADANAVHRNLSPKGEPQLGRRGLYGATGGAKEREMALLWVLNQSDGEHDLLAIAERSALPFSAIRSAAAALEAAGLLAVAR